MIALYIILGILLLFFLICLIRVQLFLLYNDEVKLSLKILFYKMTLLPAPQKKKQEHEKKGEKKEKKPKAEEKKPQEKEQKPSYLSKLKEKKGVTGLISLFTEIAKIAGGMLKGIFSHLVIKRLNVGIALNSGDAYCTAMDYGKICSVFYPAVNIITSITVCKDYHVTLEPIFDDERNTEAYADVHAYIRIGWVLKEAAKAGIRLLIARIKM